MTKSLRMITRSGLWLLRTGNPWPGRRECTFDHENEWNYNLRFCYSGRPVLLAWKEKCIYICCYSMIFYLLATAFPSIEKSKTLGWFFILFFLLWFNASLCPSFQVEAYRLYSSPTPEQTAKPWRKTKALLPSLTDNDTCSIKKHLLSIKAQQTDTNPHLSLPSPEWWLHIASLLVSYRRSEQAILSWTMDRSL